MMNKRDTVLELVNGATAPTYVPAAFFLHFDEQYHRGQAAIDKQLEFFRATGMDLVKIQYEQHQPLADAIHTPQDWAKAPRYDDAYFAPTYGVVEGLIKAVKSEALIVLTIYSPMMWADQISPHFVAHLRQDPDAVKRGLEIMTENVLTLVRGCKRLGVDGFYISTQGGEAYRFGGSPLFTDYIKPTDLAVWNEAKDCTFNILHVCDFQGGYDDLSAFKDYPGQVVNSSLKVGDKELTPRELAKFFGRPFMGGMERLGVLATGTTAEVRKAAEAVLAEAPERFILGADCTVPANTPWENLKAAIDTAHAYHRS